MELDTVSSTITNYSGLININFPVSGANNDSQGFRTNFSKIQSALSVASDEITTLQLKTTNPADLILNNHTSSELYNLGDVDDGTMVFLTDVNKPAYYFGSKWHTFTGTDVTLTGSAVVDSGDINCSGILYSIGLGIYGNSVLEGSLSLTRSQALTNGSAATLDITSHYFSTTASSTSSLAISDRAGLIKTFMMVADGGDMVTTVQNAGWKSTGTGTMTFNDIGDGCTLQYVNNKWYCVGNNGVIFG